MICSRAIAVLLSILAAALAFSVAAEEVCTSSRCTALLQVGARQQRDSLTLGNSTEAVGSPSRVAVVLVLKTLDACRAARAQEMAAQLGSRYDTWVLHARGEQPQDLLTQLRSKNVRIEAQTEASKSASWRGFGSHLSGYAKASFLKFVIKHSEYDFVWHMEDDTIFTGSWGFLFDELQRAFPTQSLVGDFLMQQYNASAWHMTNGQRKCELPGGGSCGVDAKHALDTLWETQAVRLPECPGQGVNTSCLVDAQACLKDAHACQQMVHVHALWMIMRVSHEFAVKLGAELDSPRGARGHHEAISGPFCMFQSRRKGKGWCTMATLPNTFRGIFKTGHWGNWESKIASRMKVGNLDANKLYHPAKCESNASQDMFTFMTGFDDKAMLQVRLPTYREALAQDPDLFKGCSKIFVDVGSNRGTHIRKLFEPQKYPNCPYLAEFDKHFGDAEFRQQPSSETGICAFGFEANPRWASTLTGIETAYTKQGWRVKWFNVAVSDHEGNQTFWLNDGGAQSDWGFSVEKLHSDSTEVIVQTVDLAGFMQKLDAESLKGPRLMKMDIESAEYFVLPPFLDKGLLCKNVLDTLTIEFHPWFIDDPTELKKDNNIQAQISSPHKCKTGASTHVEEYDDESFLDDGMPLP